MSKDFRSRDEILHQFARYLQINQLVICRFDITGESDGSCSFPVRGGRAYITYGLSDKFVYKFPKRTPAHIYSSIPCKSTFPFENHYNMSYPDIWWVERPHEVWVLHQNSITSLCLLPGNVFSEETLLEQSHPELKPELKLAIKNELEVRKVEVIWALPQCLKLVSQLDIPRRITIKPATSLKYSPNELAKTEQIEPEQTDKSSLPIVQSPSNAEPELSDFKLKLWSGVLERYKHGGSNWEGMKSFGLKLGLSEERIKEEIAL